MDVLYLLIPVSVVLVLLIVGVFGWAIHNGQMDDMEREGARIFDEEAGGVDGDQAVVSAAQRKFPPSQDA